MFDAISRLRSAALSPDFRERAYAGEQLVSYAEDSEAAELLLRLLLDAEDTFVTMKTSEALIARGDAAALRVYTRGHRKADSNTVEWFDNPARLGQAQRELLRRLTNDEDSEVAAGAREIVAWVNAGYGGPPPD